VKAINVGLIGAGTVGGGVVKLLARKTGFFREKLGLPIQLRRVADKDLARAKSLPTGDAIVSGDAEDVLGDKDVHVVIELIGGTTFAKHVVETALKRGKHVITANKALIAEHGPTLFEAAEAAGVSFYFEASVGGGMPTIKTIREALVANEITSIKTIINGTSNYILTQMATRRIDFATALGEAQAQGFAEADPTLDVGGGDAGHKVAIMASLVHGGYVPFERMNIEGITAVTAEDVAMAAELGYTLKLLGVIRRSEGEADVDVRVHPAMLHRDHILASVNGVLNAVLLEGDAVGPILLYGRGAGEMPTASAVVSDVVDVARNILSGTPVRISMGYYSHLNALKLRAIDSLQTRYYLRFSVLDRPGVLATIADAFGRHGISIASVIQKETSQEDGVPVIFLTHRATEKNLRGAVAEIESGTFVRAKTQVIRIEE
jgi:homoserine dehydrogenase